MTPGWSDESLLAFRPLAFGRHFIIGWGSRPRLALLALALRIHDAKIMLGMLEQVFRGDPITACLSLARHRQITLEHLIGVAADLNARAVALEVLRAMRRTRSIEMRTAPAAASVRAASASVRTTSASVATA